MAEKNSVYDILRLPMMTQNVPDKEAAAAIVKRLVPLVRENAFLKPAQAAQLVVAIHSLAKQRHKPSNVEICALVAFASSCD